MEHGWIHEEKTMTKRLFMGLLTLAAAANAAENEDFSAWAQGCKLASGATIVIPPGVHHAYPDTLPERFLHISNNDDGNKRILFDLSGLENVTIDGNGTELVMHGHMVPFYMKGAKNIVIKNLTIDWAHPFYSQAEVTAAGKGWFEFRFQPGYEVKFVDGEPAAVNPDMPAPVHFHNINFIDPEKGEQAYQSTDEYQALKPGMHTYAQKADGVFRFESAKMRNSPRAGQVVVFQYEGRTSPAIAVQRSENIRIENVTQYHAGAIANIFEGSKDIYIDKMAMTRRPGSGRWFSALNDATHHVDCRGDIHITNCLFEFQGDDAANIHGIYRTIDRMLGDSGLRLRLMHFQQLGVDSIHPGDTVALCGKADFQILGKAVVKTIAWLEGGEYCDVHFEAPLPKLDWPNTVAMLHEDRVDVRISHNRIQNNRARGVLVKTLGKVRIHDNYFHTPGAVVQIRIDASSWYEAGPVDDVEIFNNTFDQCKFGGWSRALFELNPAMNDPASEASVIKNVRIHHNTIIQVFQPTIAANNIENLEFFDNTITPGTGYPPWGKPAERFLFGKGVTTGRMQE